MTTIPLRCYRNGRPPVPMIQVKEDRPSCPDCIICQDVAVGRTAMRVPAGHSVRRFTTEATK